MSSLSGLYRIMFYCFRIDRITIVIICFAKVELVAPIDAGHERIATWKSSSLDPRLINTLSVHVGWLVGCFMSVHGTFDGWCSTLSERKAHEFFCKSKLLVIWSSLQKKIN